MKIDLFEKNLNHFVKNINENYKYDRIQGIFFLVQTYYKGFPDSYNRHSFYEHYKLSDVKDYCQNKLVADWMFDYRFSEENLLCNIYLCCLCNEKSKIEYRHFAEGHFENKRFVYQEK